MEHTRLESQRRALKDIYARGIDFSREIKRVKTLEEEVTTLLSSEDESSSGREMIKMEAKSPKGERPLKTQGSW